MGQFLGGLLSNDSAFGRVMTKLWIIMAANLMFVLFSLPVVTIGPSWVALHYCMLKSLHSDSSLPPVRTFWKGFFQNLKQGMLLWAGFVLIAGILWVDLRICRSAGAGLSWLRYPLYALCMVVFLLGIYLAPVTAAFSDTIPHLLRNALFFAAGNPVKMLGIAVLHVLPAAVTVLDERMRPLYGFLWVTCLAGTIVMETDRLLIRSFEAYLPKEEAPEAADAEGLRREENQRRTLREMKKLDR